MSHPVILLIWTRRDQALTRRAWSRQTASVDALVRIRTRRPSVLSILLKVYLKMQIYQIFLTPGPFSLRAIPDIARRRPGDAWSLRTYLRTLYEQSTNISYLADILNNY